MFFSFLAGIGGGTFSGLMASTNYYFPKSKRGFALGVQGGLSDFGTSLVQFVTPIVITFSVFGILGSPQHEVVQGQIRDIWLQNAGWVWVPLVIILSILAIVLLRSVPVTANFKTQLSIFKSKHTWFMTLFYYGTFATFAGLGAHFALMGDTIFSNVAGAPSAIAFAWVGPAIGALARVGAGKVSDKIRGGRVTTIMAAATIIGLVSSASTNLIPLQVAGSGWQLCGGCSSGQGAAMHQQPNKWQYFSRPFKVEPSLGGLQQSEHMVLSLLACSLLQQALL